MFATSEFASIPKVQIHGHLLHTMSLVFSHRFGTQMIQSDGMIRNVP